MKKLTKSEKNLLSKVADKLKNKVLFPERIEAAKEYLKNINLKYIRKHNL
jgi:hypothetical protein